MAEEAQAASRPERDSAAVMRDSLRGLHEIHSHVIEVSKQRHVAAEGELRRAPIAFNGAGLLAVVTLLNRPSLAPPLHAAAWFYFAGLVVAIGAWLIHRAMLVSGMQLAMTFSTVEAQMVDMAYVKSAEEVDRLQGQLTDGLELIRSWRERQEKAAGPVTLATVFSFGAFLTATIVLLVSI